MKPVNCQVKLLLAFVKGQMQLRKEESGTKSLVQAPNNEVLHLNTYKIYAMGLIFEDIQNFGRQ